LKVNLLAGTTASNVSARDQDVKFPFEARQLVILGRYSLYDIHELETKLKYIATVRIQ
jgi:hypothetical protein